MLNILITFILLNHVNGLEDLIVKVDDETTIRRQFCAGEELTFVCTIRTSGYLWTVGSLLSRNEGQIVVGNQSPVGRFTLSAQGSGDDRNSTLEVAAFSSLNGVLITCGDPGNSNNLQTAMITLLDMCPTDISVTVYNNCSSIDVSLTVANCTQQYIVSVSGSNDMPEISSPYLPMNYSGKELNIGRFSLSSFKSNLCSQNNVNVTAIFFDGSNMTCPTILVVPTTSGNFSSTMDQDSTTTPTSNYIKVVIVAIVVVVLIVMLAVVSVTIIIMVVLKCKSKRKRVKSKHHDNDKLDDCKPANQEHLNCSEDDNKEEFISMAMKLQDEVTHDKLSPDDDKMEMETLSYPQLRQDSLSDNETAM